MAKSRVFISYSRRDDEWKDKVLEPLRALERNGHFDVWADDDIATGDDWESEIEKAIDSSDAAILLVTNSFLNSDFILGKELRRILKKRKRGAMRVFPLIVRPCPWQAITWLARMQVRPDEGRPLVRGDEYDIEQDLADLAREVLQRLRSIKTRSGSPGTPRRRKKKLQRAGRVGVAVVSLDSGLRGWRGWLERLNALQSHITFRPSTKRLPVRAVGDIEGTEQLKVYRLRNSFQMGMLGGQDAAAIGLTRHLLAFEEGDYVCHNYLGAPSAVDHRIAFLSVANHAKYAKRAKVSMRAAFAYALASHLAWQLGGRDYHESVVGCPMDFTADHQDMVVGLRAGRFCADCEEFLKKRGKADLLKALRVFLQYGR